MSQWFQEQNREEDQIGAYTHLILFSLSFLSAASKLCLTRLVSGWLELIWLSLIWRCESKSLYRVLMLTMERSPLQCRWAQSHRLISLLSRFSRFYRSVNDSQTAALCLNKKNQVSRSVLSKSSGSASSSSPRASRSKSQSPQNGFNNLEEIFRRDQKKILANALHLKSLARYHLGDFDKAKSSLSEAEKELKFCLKDSNSNSNAETSTTRPFRLHQEIEDQHRFFQICVR